MTNLDKNNKNVLVSHWHVRTGSAAIEAPVIRILACKSFINNLVLTWQSLSLFF